MRVLYICTGNSFRSPVAEALTRRYKPDFEVESAGTDAVGHVAENGKELLAEHDALQYVKPDPDPVSQRAINEADHIVVMKQHHLDHLVEHFEISPDDITNWNVNDPINPGITPEEAFRKILQNVRSF